MYLLVLVAVILITNHFSESSVVQWSACPELRSTFEGVFTDEEGKKSPKCVCKQKMFGDQCQYKVYVAAPHRKNNIFYPENSHQPEHNIFPLRSLAVDYKDKRNLVVKWHALHDVGVRNYILQFREYTATHGRLWRPLGNINTGKFSQEMKYALDDFSGYTAFEVNLGLVKNDVIILSVSVFYDAWKPEEIILKSSMFSESKAWSLWSPWGTCESPLGCGRGKQNRSRTLMLGNCLQENEKDTRPCKLNTCPVNGGWSQWTGWSKCTATCNNGTRSRLRLCMSPSPSHGGETCFGPRTVIETCVNLPCVDPPRSEWSTGKKIKNIDVVSFIVGVFTGFLACLLIIASLFLYYRFRQGVGESSGPGTSQLPRKSWFPQALPKPPEMPIASIYQSMPKLPVPPPPPPPPISAIINRNPKHSSGRQSISTLMPQPNIPQPPRMPLLPQIPVLPRMPLRPREGTKIPPRQIKQEPDLMNELTNALKKLNNRKALG